MINTKYTISTIIEVLVKAYINGSKCMIKCKENPIPNQEGSEHSIGVYNVIL